MQCCLDGKEVAFQKGGMRRTCSTTGSSAGERRCEMKLPVLHGATTPSCSALAPAPGLSGTGRRAAPGDGTGEPTAAALPAPGLLGLNGPARRLGLSSREGEPRGTPPSRWAAGSPSRWRPSSGTSTPGAIELPKGWQSGLPLWRSGEARSRPSTSAPSTCSAAASAAPAASPSPSASTTQSWSSASRRRRAGLRCGGEPSCPAAREPANGEERCSCGERCVEESCCGEGCGEYSCCGERGDECCNCGER